MLVAGLGLAGCGDDSPRQNPAPVLNLGAHSDSSTGAMMVTARDNLWDIAKRYRLPMMDIIALNNLEPPYKLSRGQRLKLPAPVDYRVREGDTLQSVANTFGVSVSRLVSVNKLREPYRLALGQNLRVPSVVTERPMAKAQSSAMVAAPRKRAAPEERKEVAAAAAPSLKPTHRAERADTTLLPSARPDFMWPVRGKVISGYGAKDDGLYNDGINIAVPKGTPVSAAAEGVVAYVGNDLKSYGNLVLLRHGGGMMTAYAHLSSIRVKKGALVRKGQSIATVGSTGSVTSTQLHFEIRQGSKTFDPQKYL